MTDKPLLDDECFIEIVEGKSGALSLYISTESGGYRLAGPKPFGVFNSKHVFRVKMTELKREIDSIESFRKIPEENACE